MPRAVFWDANHASAPSLIHHGQLVGCKWSAGVGVPWQPVLSQTHVARCDERRKKQSCEQGKINHGAKHPDYCPISPGQVGCSSYSPCCLWDHHGQPPLRSLEVSGLLTSLSTWPESCTLCSFLTAPQPEQAVPWFAALPWVHRLSVSQGLLEELEGPPKDAGTHLAVR